MIMAIDYKEKYFDEKFNSIGQSIERLSEDLRKNTELTLEVKAQAERTNGRVTALEKENQKSKPITKEKDLPPALKDPKLVAIAFNVSLAILILIATLTGFNLTGLLP